MTKQTTQRGFTLLEVVVSLSLITILLLGLDAAEADVLKQTRVSANTDKAHSLISAFTAYQFAHRVDGIESLPQRWEGLVESSLPQGNAVLGANALSPLVVAYGGASASQCGRATFGTSGCTIMPA